MEVDCGFPHLSVYVSLITNLKLNKSMKKIGFSSGMIPEG